MPANITDILAATETVLTELYADIPVEILKDGPGPDPSSELAGWRPGMPTTCFVLSCVGPEEVSGMSSFEEVFTRYPVKISYVFPSAKSPGRWEEVPDVREKRQAIKMAFYGRRFPSLYPMTFDVRFRTGKVYETLSDKQLIITSDQFADFQTYEVRET